jgi:Catalase
VHVGCCTRVWGMFRASPPCALHVPCSACNKSHHCVFGRTLPTRDADRARRPFRFVLSMGDKAHFVKFHWHTDQGVKNLTDDEAVQKGGENASFATTDLFTSIENGEYPSWTLKVQLIPCEDEQKFIVRAPAPFCGCCTARTSAVSQRAACCVFLDSTGMDVLCHAAHRGVRSPCWLRHQTEAATSLQQMFTL